VTTDARPSTGAGGRRGLVAYGGRVDAGTTSLPDGTRPRGYRPGVVVALCALVCVGSVAGVLALWSVFVDSLTGQQVEAAAVRGARFGQTALWRVAEHVLSVVSVTAIAGVLLVAVVIAVVRRRWELAVQVALVAGGANLTTQVLKYVFLPRPDLGVEVGSHANTLPSGHTTAAASIAVVLLLVVPARVRPVAALVGALYTAATGVSTLIGQWHRPSDVVAGVLVVLGWTAATCAITALWPARLSEDALDGPPPTPRSQTAALVVLGLVVVVAGLVAAVLLDGTWRSAVVLESREDLLTAYGGGVAGSVAAVAAAFAIVLVLRTRAGRRLRNA